MAGNRPNPIVVPRSGKTLTCLRLSHTLISRRSRCENRQVSKSRYEEWKVTSGITFCFLAKSPSSPEYVLMALMATCANGVNCLVCRKREAHLDGHPVLLERSSVDVREPTGCDWILTISSDLIGEIIRRAFTMTFGISFWTMK